MTSASEARDDTRTKQCTGCKLPRPLDAFDRVSSQRTARRSRCRDCVRARKNDPTYRAQQARYARHRRRTDPAAKIAGYEKARAYGQTIRGRANRLFLAARQRAETQGVEFSLTQDFIERALITGVCPKTGVAFCFLSPSAGRRFNPHAPSVDRKDPFGPYSQDNVQIVINAYNLAKNQLTDAELVVLCRQILEHQ